jgi:ABC-type multidrug transport system fused ATPase/permease subunit
MINGLVRSPCSFFDSTPSGQLNNKFSNDLGVLDNNLSFGMIDALEGPILGILALINVCQINVYFVIPSVIMLVILILFFNYSR